MKKIFLVIILSILPAAALSHPGKTDRYGGHQCLKGCEEWGLFYKEYHYHDKDGKPIRIVRDKRAPEPIVNDVPKSFETRTTSMEATQPEKLGTEVVTTYRYVTNVYEENIFSTNPFLYILLILLLLLLILRMNRKREEG
jgi:hypothetical protein